MDKVLLVLTIPSQDQQGFPERFKRWRSCDSFVHRWVGLCSYDMYEHSQWCLGSGGGSRIYGTIVHPENIYRLSRSFCCSVRTPPQKKKTAKKVNLTKLTNSLNVHSKWCLSLFYTNLKNCPKGQIHKQSCEVGAVETIFRHLSCYIAEYRDQGI